MKDTAFRLFTGLHRAIFQASKGRLLGKGGGMPVLMLTTTGRKSGKKRDTMLTTPYQEGDKIILVASFGGDPRHPTWFLNLRDNPDVEATMGGSRRRMRAHVASKEEKAEIWPKITSKHKNYAGYQTKTTRDIPVVILEPA